MKDKNVIVKVCENKANKQRFVTIPRNSDIKVGDIVFVTKMNMEEMRKNAIKK